MQIMVCDDEIQELNKVKEIIDKYIMNNPNINISSLYFSNPFEMLNFVDKNGAPDIAVLDICMEGLSGTELAKEIQSDNKTTSDIIFLTTSSDYAVEAYTMRAQDYIKKPYTKKRLLDTLTRIIEERQLHKYIIVKCEKEITRIDAYNIIFAETVRGIIQIHLKSGERLKTHMTLIKFAELFKDISGFAMIGASYLINFRYVTNIGTTSLETQSGDILVIPRRLRSNLKQDFFDFCKHQDIERKNRQ